MKLDDDIQKIIENIDESIESIITKFSSFDLTSTPFVQDFYTPFKKSVSVHTRIDIKRYFISYDIFPISFLEFPLIRGIRVQNKEEFYNKIYNLANNSMSLKTLRRYGKSTGIWEKSKGTFVTYLNITEYKSKDKKEDILIKQYLYYFNIMHCKPLIKIENKILKNKLKIWYYDKVYPNPLSFLSTNINEESIWIVPFTGFLISKLESNNYTDIKIGDTILKAKKAKSYILATNFLDVKYLGPFLTYFPKIEGMTSTWEVTTNSFFIDYYLGFIMINPANGGYLLNLPSDKSNFILPIKTLPFDYRIYLMANRGKHECKSIKVPTFGYLKVPIIKYQEDKKLIKGFSSALKRFSKKYPLTSSIIPSKNLFFPFEMLYSTFINDILEDLRVQDDIYLDPYVYLYFIGSNINIKQIIYDPSKITSVINNLTTFSKYTSYILDISTLKMKHIEMVRKLIKNYNLYVVI